MPVIDLAVGYNNRRAIALNEPRLEQPYLKKKKRGKRDAKKKTQSVKAESERRFGLVMR